VLTTLTLARWLGPWADPQRAPDVAITDEDVDGMRVRLFRPPRQPRRVFLIAQGLHYAGADDPRLDRFCRILARAGHLVIAPYVPSYLALTPNDQAKREFMRALAALPRWTDQKPVIFSISFGSLLAFAAAAEHPDRVERLVVFGGYAEFREMMRFCLTGEIEGGRQGARDPLNQPVVLMNLLHLIDCVDRPALLEAWRRYVMSTWGRPELKVGTAFVPIAERLAPSVPEAVRELFLVGVGARPGAAPLALEALSRFDDRELDPRPYLSRVRCRVDLVHGTDDDVVPYEHAHALGARLASSRVHITGLYGHSGVSKPSLRMMTKELATMVRVLLAMR
jgi:pimeloyl-ACP methyl ester carboxylesterase